MQDCPNTPIVVQFLATSLARFMEMNRLNGQRWSKRLVADHITTSDQIAGQISDTTLGRFLDPKHSQKPTDATVSVIAQFLLWKRVITPLQIELAHKSSAHWKASIFADVFDNPTTESYQHFLRDISGRYASMNVNSTTLLLSEVIIEYLPVANALVINEIMSLYHVGNIDILRSKTSNFDPLFSVAVDGFLRPANARLKVSTVSTGFVTATSGIMAFFHRPSGRGFTSIFNISSVLFSKNDSIMGFKGNRNTGWQSEESGQIKIPKRKSDITNSMEEIKYLSIDLAYTKVFVEKIQAMRTTERSNAPIKKGTSQEFYFDTEKLMPSKLNSDGNGDGDAPDKRLVEAFVKHDFDGFVKALENGADPNIVPPGYSDPLIFPLARDGEFEWVDILTVSGRCDLTQTDSNGFVPSHAPAVIARSFNQSGQESETIKRFIKTTELLQKLEIEQLKEAAAPLPPSS